MTVDEAAVHAAILAINEALDKEDPAETLAALQNPNACLVKVDESSASRYHDLLLTNKREKASKAQEVRMGVDVGVCVCVGGGGGGGVVCLFTVSKGVSVWSCFCYSVQYVQ